MLRFSKTCVAAVCIGLTGMAFGVSPAVATAATNPTACGPLWSDGASDAPVTGSGQQDQLDIVSGGLSDDATTLTTTLTLKNLSTNVPPGASANEYYFVFPGSDGKQYFTNAEVSALGVFYSYGTYDPNTGYNGVGSAGGTFKAGPNGTITVTVALSAVGNPSGTLPAKTTGTSPTPLMWGEADVLVGAPAVGGATQPIDHDDAAYDYAMGSCASPSASSSSGSPVDVGNAAFANYGSPIQNTDLAQRQNAGEPSIGADWKTGNIMYMAGTQVSRISFNPSATAGSPPISKWTDVTPPEISTASEDSILYTDSLWGGTNRTWAEDFLVNPGCNANMAYTDNDGGSAGLGTDWSPEQCPFAVGPDHPSVGAGPYAGTPPSGAYPRIVYYCSQNILTIAGAECTHSTDGGSTWSAPAHIFGTGTPCQAIHGHIRVSPDGTMYVPQRACGSGQGFAFSTDNGNTFNYAVVPDSKSGATDPSVAADAANTIYFGYEDASGHPKIAVSKDRGKTWSPSTDVGAPFNITNSKFPEVIAGDAGRAAVAFLGTDCPKSQQGCSAGDQSASFPGVWDLYISFTYDGGASWHTVDATPGDPVQRGCIWNGGGSNPCRNLLDFNEITIDKQGRVYVAYTDGCTKGPSYDCDTNPAIDSSGCGPSEGASPDSTATCTYGRHSSVVRQICGEGLIAASDPGFTEGPNCPGSGATTTSTSTTSGGGSGGGTTSVAGPTRGLQGIKRPLCPAPSGRLSGHRLGPVALGMPLARVRRVLPLAWKRTFWEDFCLNGGAGIRVAVPSPKLLRSLPPAKRSAFRNRVIIALTANPYYALRGIRPGQRLPSSLRRVRSYRVGLNRWYLIASGSVDGLLKVRHGRVLEVGIADRRLMPRAITRR